MRQWLLDPGAICQSTTDTEVILHLVARARRGRFVDKFIDSLRQLEGSPHIIHGPLLPAENKKAT